MIYLWFHTVFGIWLLEGTYLSLFQIVSLIVIFCGHLASITTWYDIHAALYCFFVWLLRGTFLSPSEMVCSFVTICVNFVMKASIDYILVITFHFLFKVCERDTFVPLLHCFYRL